MPEAMLAVFSEDLVVYVLVIDLRSLFARSQLAGSSLSSSHRLF